MPSIAEYVGIPYQLHGRSRTGADCYGLVVMVYRDILGITLEDYDYASRVDAGALIDVHRTRWKQLAEPEHWAVAVIRNGLDPMHCGIIVDHDLMLHTHAGGASCVVRFQSPNWAPRILGYYAHD